MTSQAVAAPGATYSRDELTRRSVEIILSQTRAGAVALALAGPLYGVVLVPRVGWLPWAAWYAVLLASLAMRQVHFARLVGRWGHTRRTLRRVAIWAGITGVLPPLCVPLFVEPWLPAEAPPPRALFTAGCICTKRKWSLMPGTRCRP